MTPTFQEHLQNAAVYLQEDRLEDSITEYSQALQEARNPQEQIDLYNVLGRLYQRSKNAKEAISAFKASLRLSEENPSEKSGTDTAAIHNNLASVLLPTNVPEAITHYQKALGIYESTCAEKGNEFSSHLGNTHFALAEALVLEGRSAIAKKHFKEAIKRYENLPECSDLRARAHYQLGLIYTDEFNLHDALTQYTKAIKLYETLSSTGNSGLAVLAALFNNLGVTYNSMEERDKAVKAYQRSLELYRQLGERHSEVFLPYEAATLNSLGITFAEIQETQKAIEHMQGSIDRYHQLADAHPEQYEHYLATALHNQGLFYFEQKDPDQAEHFFSEALALRKKMAREEPGLFGPDACATALNLVELFQMKLEATLDMDLRKISLKLLEEVQDLLAGLKDERLVVKNMRAGCESYLTFFNEISLEELTVNFVKFRANALREEIHSTIEPSEKLVYQKELTDLLSEKYLQFSENEVLRSMLAMGHNDISWLLIRLGRTQEALKHIHEGQKLDPQLALLDCNLGHCYLLENNTDLALQGYSKFLGSEGENAANLWDLLRADLRELKKSGIEETRLELIQSRLSL